MLLPNLDRRALEFARRGRPPLLLDSYAGRFVVCATTQLTDIPVPARKESSSLVEPACEGGKCSLWGNEVDP